MEIHGLEEYFNLEDEGVHIRFNDVDRLVRSEVILHSASQLLHLLLDFIGLHINLLELRREIWIDDVVILLGLADIDALLEHGLQLSELF